MLWDEGLLHCVPFILDANSLKLSLQEAVFLKSLRPLGLGNALWLF